MLSLIRTKPSETKPVGWRRTCLWMVCGVIGLVALLNELVSKCDMRQQSRTHWRRPNQVAPIDLWFTAIDLDGPVDSPMFLMLKVAVLSAQRHSQLIPIVLATGECSSMEAWLHDHNVIVYKNISTPIIRHLKAHPQEFTDLGIGTWLRLAVPDIVAKLQGEEKHLLANHVQRHRNVSFAYILYTDADIYFTNPFSFPQKYLPRYVAMVVQGDAYAQQDDYSKELHTNAGVVVMNVSSSSEWNTQFEDFVIAKVSAENHKGEMSNHFNDQTAFHLFFPIRIKSLTLWKFVDLALFHSMYFQTLFTPFYADPLPKIYEWEPYLGRNKKAIIVHWHGYKLRYPDNCTMILDAQQEIPYAVPLLELTKLSRAGAIALARDSQDAREEDTQQLRRMLSRPKKGATLPNLLEPESAEGYRAEILRFHRYIDLICNISTTVSSLD